MERQNRLLTILSLVLLSLLAVVLLDKGEKKSEFADEDAPARNDLFDYENDQVTRLTLRRAGVELSFEKAEGVWKMTAPRAMEVDQRKVSELVERFGSLEVEERAIDGKPENLGMDAAQRAELVLEGNGKTWRVWIGKDTNVGYASYVQTEENGSVHLASSKVADLVARGPDDFRSREVWDVSSATARRVRIDAGGSSVVLRKDDHGWWLGDDGPRADKEAVDTWFSGAQGLRVEAFEEGVTPAAVGLEPPAARIVVEGEGATATLSLGPTTPDGVKALVGGGVVDLGATAAEVVKLEGWASTRLVSVRRYQVDRMEVRLGDKELVLTRQDGEWKTAEGTASPLGDGLLTKLEDAKADWSATGLPELTETWGRVLLAEGDQRQELVTIGQLLPDGRRVAKDAAGGPRFAVSVEELEVVRGGMP